LPKPPEDPDALLLALHARHDALAGPDDIVERLAVAERAGQLARGRANRADVAFWAHLWRIEDNLQLGGWTRSPGTSDLSSISSTRWAGPSDGGTSFGCTPRWR
jgi:hypothetical protein